MSIVTDGDTDGVAEGHDDQPAEPSPGSAHVTAALFASASADGTQLLSCIHEQRGDIGAVVSAGAGQGHVPAG